MTQDPPSRIIGSTDAEIDAILAGKHPAGQLVILREWVKSSTSCANFFADVLQEIYRRWEPLVGPEEMDWLREHMGQGAQDLNHDVRARLHQSLKRYRQHPGEPPGPHDSGA
jgi:hypothetical protein